MRPNHDIGAIMVNVIFYIMNYNCYGYTFATRNILSQSLSLSKLMDMSSHLYIADFVFHC